MDRRTLRLPDPMRMITKLAITAVVAVGGGGLLIGASFANASHYRMVDQLVREGFDGWSDKEIAVHGFVEPDSIHLKVVEQQTARTFVLAMNGQKLRVFYQGPVPDAFKDNSEIIATGALVRASTEPLADAFGVRADSEHAWVLDATSVTAKCPVHYSDQSRVGSAKF
jgi:cytochrome c-type biogenesis protein CcmE